jgi:alpha-beta hydrolase superfamily lysophospholipase
MRVLRWSLGALAVLILAGAATITTLIQANESTIEAQQSRVADFYADPALMPSRAGELLRHESLTQADGTPVVVEGAQSIRFLYSSRRPDGQVAVSGGMAFIPTSSAPLTGRPVLAWAHGTVGQGDACAPSRSADPVKPIATWLPQAIYRGMAVIATDYTGLGTTGPNLYLVGAAEAADVVHAIQAARQLPGAELSQDVVAMGHSQGGHSALWTGSLATTLDPAIDLKGVIAIAPAAQLVDIMEAQWQSPVAWLIGPEVMAAWPMVDSQLTDDVLTPGGQAQSTRLANECIGTAVGEGLARQLLGDRYFAKDPLSVPAWLDFAKAQTPPPIAPTIPVYLGQSTADTVVLAWPNADLERAWCAAGSSVSATWIADVGHMNTALVLGPGLIQWAEARFAGEPAVSTCGIGPPRIARDS